MLLIFGTRKRPITIEDFLIKCPACETSTWHSVMFESEYFHIFWVPIIPTDKIITTQCSKCDLIRSGFTLSSRFINNYEEVKNKFRHPWYHYIGIGIFALIVISIIIAVIS
jgi:hypothetical protein